MDSQGARLIIDAGSGLILLGNDIAAHHKNESEFHILLSHTHIDHIQGFVFFKPIHMKDTLIHLYCLREEQQNLKHTFDRLFQIQYSPIGNLKRLSANVIFHDLDPERIYNIANFNVLPVPTNHTSKTMAYRIDDQWGHRFGYITDHNAENRPEINDTICHHFKKTSFIFHDAMFTPEKRKRKWYRGHSSYLGAIENAKAIGCKAIGLIHHDPNHTDTMLDDLQKTVLSELTAPLNLFYTREGTKISLARLDAD